MIKIKKVTMRNFMSIGQDSQTVFLSNTGLTLILGENLDQDASDYRNGVGKTALIQAICYAFYGVPITNIKRDNLINKINKKNMSVELEYTVNNKRYKIERGRKPTYLRFFVDDLLVNQAETDEGAGESKITQAEIEKTIQMSHTLFKHIVSLHTKTVPFLSLGPQAQREIIEELISITQISQKAEKLKEIIKELKDEIKSEEIRLKTAIEANDRVQVAINDLNFKSKNWDREQDKKINKLAEQLAELESINIDEEIENHRSLKIYNEKLLEYNQLSKEYQLSLKQVESLQNSFNKKVVQLESTSNQTCPTCNQGLTHEHTHLFDKFQDELLDLESKLNDALSEMNLLAEAFEIVKTSFEALGDKPKVKYKNIEQALEHRHSIEKLSTELLRESDVENPYIEQIANLSFNALHEISYQYINEMIKMKEHQDFLLKLLISKDSFIRKKIIDQNLNYLNFRLGYYLEKLKLPHEVEFKSDLSVEITKLGNEYDFEQMSNGEQNRLILSLAWSFRDIWESMNTKLNLMMIDELVDSGFDGAGTKDSISVLKSFARENNRNIFLISHKDGLESHTDQILLVQKENDFTTYVDQTN
jgi:DNA repair exonuclease SbcCD ATPase subunit